MQDSDDIRKQFDQAVNMSAGELKNWLDSDEAKEVGQKKGSSESTGHQAGRRIVTILHTKKADLTESDYEHMDKVVSYVHRHLAQRPAGDITETRWRYSLMNWGHDPKAPDK